MRRFSRASLTFLVPIAAAACGVPEQDHTRVVAERDSLVAVLAATTKELDAYRFDPDRMLAQARLAFDSADYEKARTLASQLVTRHPQVTQAGVARELAGRAERTMTEITARREKARADSVARVEKARTDSLAAVERRRTAAIRALRKKTDDVSGITFYYAPGNGQFVNSRSEMLLYIAKGSYSPSLYLTLRYVDDDWLFIQAYTIKADDQTFFFPVDYGDVERDNGYGGIWEWHTRSAGSRELAMVRAVVASRRAVLRYHGQQYNNDRVITAAEKRALQQILDAYDVMSKS